MLPLSKYRKGRGGFPPPIFLVMNSPTYRPCWIATCATPGNGRPSWIKVAASPTTNIPPASATFKNGPTHARPARSVATPSILTIGDGETPAVHKTVPLSILFPPTVTPLSSMFSTKALVITFTPSLARRWAALADDDSAKLGSTRFAPSSRKIDVVAGSIRRKLARRVVVAICAIDAANSTPVGPAPTRTNVICRRRSSSSSVDSAISYALRIFERILCASVMVFRQGAYLAHSL